MHPLVRRTIVVSVAVLLAHAAGVHAQPSNGAGAPSPSPTGAPPKGFRPPVAVTRADLGAAYLELDHAVAAANLHGDEAAEINRAFDSLTGRFFAGDFAGATRRVHELTRRVRAEPEPDAGARVARSLKAGPQPPVAVAGGDTPVVVRFTSMYAVPEAAGGAPGALRVQFIDPSGTTARDAEMPLGAGPIVDVRTAEWRVPKDAVPGRYRIAVGTPGGPMFTAGWLSVTQSAPDDTRAALERALDAAGRATPELARAAAIARSRAALLTSDPSEAKSAEFLADPAALMAEVRREVDRIAEGQDPYRHRRGDWWLRVPVGGAAGDSEGVPARVYAPPTMPPGAPAPLVIALHGAGGDENMFMDGYGAGLIKRLADARGFVVLSPRTERLMSGPSVLDALVRNASALYDIDPARVYLVGHSMGAMTAASLAASRAGTVAAAACIAGGPTGTGRGARAPTAIYAAALDGLIPASRLERAARSAQKARQRVEFEIIEHWGHTLVVGHVLERAVDWLLQQRVGGEAPAR